MRCWAMHESRLRAHLEAAAQALQLRYETPAGGTAGLGSLADELERIETAIAPRGGTQLSGIADAVRAAETEIADALRLLRTAG